MQVGPRLKKTGRRNTGQVQSAKVKSRTFRSFDLGQDLDCIFLRSLSKQQQEKIISFDRTRVSVCKTNSNSSKSCGDELDILDLSKCFEKANKIVVRKWLAINSDLVSVMEFWARV